MSFESEEEEEEEEFLEEAEEEEEKADDDDSFIVASDAEEEEEEAGVNLSTDGEDELLKLKEEEETLQQRSKRTHRKSKGESHTGQLMHWQVNALLDAEIANDETRIENGDKSTKHRKVSCLLLLFGGCLMVVLHYVKTNSLTDK